MGATELYALNYLSRRSARGRINYSRLQIVRDIIASTSQVAAATESGSRRFFLRHSFLGDDDFWELHDVGDRLGSILTESRLERQFSVSDLG